MLKVRAVVLLSTIGTGCAAVGQYHRGYHYLGEHQILWGAVGQQYVAPAQAFEDGCAKKVVSHDLAGLRDSFAPSLQDALSHQQLTDIDQLLARTYRFDGTFVRIMAMPQPFMLDEGVIKDAFLFYDFVGVQFELGGEPVTYLELYMTRIDEKPKLVGFAIFDDRCVPDGKGPACVRHLFPETIDNAHIRDRGMVKAGPALLFTP